MNYLVISPYYPENFQQFSIDLAKQGVKVLGIGQEPYQQLGPDLQEALTEYFRVDDLEDLDQVKKAVAFLFYKHGPIDRIESQNEYWLELDAALRQQFDVFGVRPDDLVKTKYKSEMKKLFQKAGVPVVPGQVVEARDQVDAAVKSLGLPLIAKPDNGVGAAATYKLSRSQDVEEFKSKWDESTAYFLEQFIQTGQVCTYDGLIDSQGNIVFAASFDYAHSPLDLILYKMDNSYYVLKEIPEKLAKYGQAIVKAFGMKERFFHIEFFKDGDDYIALEYNNRPAGGFTIDLYNYAQSRDLYKEYAQVVTGQEVAQPQLEPEYALATSRRFHKEYAYTQEELMEKYQGMVKAVFLMPHAFAELQGDILYMLTTPDRKVMDQMIADFSKLKD